MTCMIDFQRVWNWYSRESVLKALAEVARNREVVVVYRDGSFGKRPDVIQYPQDVLADVAEGAVAFHGSVERWQQPMKLDVGMSKADLDNLRSGWDVFIDIDIDDFEIAKIAARHMLDALKDHGLSNYSIKFTGGSSFHIGVPFEALPENINTQPTSLQYPDILQKIIEYLKWYVRDNLKESLLEIGPQEISKRIGKPMEQFVENNEINPFKIMTVDIFGSRHLFRLPYSLHEKTMLVSLPIKPENLEKFEKEQAMVEKVKVDERFLVPKVSLHDADALIIEALDWSSKHSAEPKEEIPKPLRMRKMRVISEEYFPPCIKIILQGLADGKKRSMFILINYLRNVGWDLAKIESKLFEWNEKNTPPIRTNYLRTQMRWHFRQERNLLPPNCENEMFYINMGVCKPDATCTGGTDKIVIKNPVNYPYKKLNFGKKGKKKIKYRPRKNF